MAAGDSAEDESARLRQYARLLDERAQNFLIAAESERTLSKYLKELIQFQWRVLEDREWPNSSRANIDFLVVGPPGVLIIDAKEWAEVSIINGQLFRGDADETATIDKHISLIDRLADVLADHGLVPSAIQSVLAFTNQSMKATPVGPSTAIGATELIGWLLSRPPRLAPENVHAIADDLELACPPKGPVPTQAKTKVPRKPRAKDEALDEPLIEFDEVHGALNEALLAKPIEDWMTFIHPEQNKLVRAQWNGPYRIRGPAGTGKTVVGLHRAVYLAQRSDLPVLFTSFVKTLPRVQAALARRISPAGAENIEFASAHQLAYRVLELSGVGVRIDLDACSRAFERAWAETQAADKLARFEPRPDYWREEIDYVIKGRGILDFDTYRDLERVGRKTTFPRESRVDLWNLYCCYSELLDEAGVCDFNDLIMNALDVLDETPGLLRYGAVIVDEVQDLTLTALQFLARLARDDQVLLIGDGQQSVYPGGFNLSEAGINITGRSTVLKVNYRNTIEILNRAMREVSHDRFGDLEGQLEHGGRDVEIARHGHAPIEFLAGSQLELEARLVDQIIRTRDYGIPLGDMAVLVAYVGAVSQYQRVLRAAGVPTVELTAYDGVTQDKVKIGTFKRGKGLDFKYVLMPGLRHSPPARRHGEAESAYAERLERFHRELFVGMTRARDGLWLGYLPH
ncbi:Superfamily I DNA and RNA helicases [Nocardioides sp. J9]|uniref:nuclease-related domain-containing DEAD/DEAH box helicase n=1 Tax=Nocardioides sp. J9 TaxID=935844 RepID=UPI0011ADAA70|nr:UvrD-helicase domain-containing protein [Nocardioides sp. J9]TWG93057.1 Superfamily I DNA and RNA helicases [Nocardioides sp. J9]